MALELRCQPRQMMHNERTGEAGLFVYSPPQRNHIRSDGCMSNRIHEPTEFLVDVIRGDELVREAWWTSDGIWMNAE